MGRIFPCLLAACWLSPMAIVMASERQELRAEAVRNRDDGPKRWHWLYDEEHRPATTGAASAERSCTVERVRVPRGDGTTTVARIDRCE